MLFNGKYYNKPGHLGMTTEELKEALQGGGGGGVLPEIDPADEGKILVVASDGKLKLLNTTHTITCTSEDGTNWTADVTFNQLQEIINLTTVPIRFNFEFYVGAANIGMAANVIGGIISQGGTSLVSFMLSPTAFVTINESNDVSVYLE